MHKNILKHHFENGDYKFVINETRKHNDSFSKIMMCAAMMKIGCDYEEVLTLLQNCDSENYTQWNGILQQDCLKLLGRHADAIQICRKIIKNGLATEYIINSLHDSLIWNLDFETAKSERMLYFDKIGVTSLNKISESTSNKHAIVIQSYVKYDTLKIMLQSLLDIESIHECHLLICQDHCKGGVELQKKHRKVTELIEKFLSEHSQKFYSTLFIKQNKNLGTSITCVNAINTAFNEFQCESVSFFEDDVVISNKYLLFVQWAIISLNTSVPIASGESIYFNDKTHSLKDSDKISIFKIRDFLEGLYDTISFIPSTSFIVRRHMWERLWIYRSMPRGPESLTLYCANFSLRCYFPVVPYVSDFGMRHPDGYSVSKSHHATPEVKNCYTLSHHPSANFKKNIISKDVIYDATCNLSHDTISDFLNYFGA